MAKYIVHVIEEHIIAKEYAMTASEYQKYQQDQKGYGSKRATDFVKDTGTVTRRQITPLTEVVALSAP